MAPWTNTQPARGMRDFLPDDVRRREYVIGVIGDVYRRYGFEPLETPAVENIETLMGKYGEEGDRLIFKILKRGEEGRQTGDADLALRYDLTVPLARVVANIAASCRRFFKRYQVQPVWRADRPQKGPLPRVLPVRRRRRRIEVAGGRSRIVRRRQRRAARARIHRLHDPTESSPAAARRCSTRAGVDCVHARRRAGRPGQTRQNRAHGVEAELQTRGIDAAVWRRSSRVLEASDVTADNGAHNAGSFAFFSSGLPGMPTCVTPWPICASVSSWPRHVAAPHIRFDPSLARGLSYYTGTIMEIAVPDLAGSLGGGGRYDSLIGMFSAQRSRRAASRSASSASSS